MTALGLPNALAGLARDRLIVGAPTAVGWITALADVSSKQIHGARPNIEGLLGWIDC
jgi:hypothetical protein